MTRAETTLSHKIGSDKMKQVGQFTCVLLIDAILVFFSDFQYIVQYMYIGIHRFLQLVMGTSTLVETAYVTTLPTTYMYMHNHFTFLAHAPFSNEAVNYKFFCRYRYLPH